jgi:hypothetical protein
VTRLAFLPFLAFVLVFLFVAGIALSLELWLALIQIPLMATLALYFVMLAQQRILGCFAMIEQDLFPIAVGMASYAFHTEITFVFVSLLVTFDAFSRCVLEYVAGVAGTAFHTDVLAKDIESGFAVIEMKCLPVLLFMTALACLAQGALVLILLGMTGIAGLCHLPIFFAREMTVLAENLLRKMSPLQFKTGLFCMIEVFSIEFNQRDIAPPMFVVAFMAGFFFYMLSMQAMLDEFILRNLFVTVLAQVRLG